MKITKKMAIFNTNLFQTLRLYLLLTQPLHKIKNQGVEVLCIILYLYHISEKELDRDKWDDVFSYENRIKMRVILGKKLGKDMTEATFNNHLSTLRKMKVISKNNTVENRFNPVIAADADVFEMVLRFNLKR